MGVIRLFLALVVVYDHTRAIALMPLGAGADSKYALGFNGGFAVMFFYVISGFLISFVLAAKYNAGATGTTEFYRNRFIRIFSLYWPMAIAVLILSPSTLSAFWHGPPPDKFTSLFLFGMDWNVSFSIYPDRNGGAALATIPQAWSLGVELTFYLIAPFVLRSRVAVVSVFAASALVRAIVVAKFGYLENWTYQFFPSTVLFFMLGDIARRAADRNRFLLHPALAITLIATTCLLLMYPTYAPWDSMRFWLAVVSFSIGLPGIFELTKKWRWMNFLGDLSYPVYIVHMFIILEFIRLGYVKSLNAAAGSYAVVGVTISATIIGAVVALYIEKIVATCMQQVWNYAAEFRRQHRAKAVELNSASN